MRYLKSWFLLDVYAFYPLGYLRYISVPGLGENDALTNFLQYQNWDTMNRAYKVFLLPQIARARFAPRYFDLFLKNQDMKIEKKNVIRTIVLLAFILHLTGCCWMAATTADDTSNDNWITANTL